MAEGNGVYACEKGDKVKHFYIPLGPECIPACDPDSSRVRELSKGGNKPKCKACKKAVGGQ